MKEDRETKVDEGEENECRRAFLTPTKDGPGGVERWMVGEGRGGESRSEKERKEGGRRRRRRREREGY